MMNMMTMKWIIVIRKIKLKQQNFQKKVTTTSLLNTFKIFFQDKHYQHLQKMFLPEEDSELMSLEFEQGL